MSAAIMEPRARGIAQKPTSYLTHAESGTLSQLDILHLVQAGFALSDVKAMVGSSRLFTAHKLLERIIGKSTRTIQRLNNTGDGVCLNAQQSAVAFQYASVLGLAIIVFGSQELAENWLGRSCAGLSGIIPFEILDISLGFSIVEDYLERVRLGVYQ